MPRQQRAPTLLLPVDFMSVMKWWWYVYVCVRTRVCRGSSVCRHLQSLFAPPEAPKGRCTQRQAPQQNVRAGKPAGLRGETSKPKCLLNKLL